MFNILPLVSSKFCDTPYMQTSQCRSHNNAHSAVIHHQRMTPVSLDRKVSVRLRTPYFHKPDEIMGPYHLHSFTAIFLKPDGALEHGPRATQQADG
jgi:hypothetical protein